MARIVVELTNRCNLKCLHCYDERHAADGDLPLPVIDALLDQGHANRIDHIALTGGEPTVHRRFSTIVRSIAAAGYSFSLVSNGINFQKVYALLAEHRDNFSGITFSMDGASERTHDQLRGSGSFRRLMRAASLCVARNLPFTFNMVLTSHNLDEVGELISLATVLGSSGVRFGHYLHDPVATETSLALTIGQRRDVERAIHTLAGTASIPVLLAPGYFTDPGVVACAPLRQEEFNLDRKGNLTLCCQVSGMFGPNPDALVLGNLSETTLHDALRNAAEFVHAYLRVKQRRVSNGDLDEWDQSPCVYCTRYLRGLVGTVDAGNSVFTVA